MNTERENLIDVVDGFDTAMLVTHLSSTPDGRPMSIAAHEDGELWFITSRTSPKAAEVREDDDAMVTLQSRTAYALLRGRAALVDDRARMEKLWSKGADLYFPDGPTDPRAILLRFSPFDGQYWDMRGTTGLRYAAEAAKALFTGERVSSDADTEGKASF